MKRIKPALIIALGVKKGELVYSLRDSETENIVLWADSLDTVYKFLKIYFEE